MAGSPADDRPVPDPTTLTLDLVRREILHLREIIDERKEKNEQRFKCQEELANLMIASSKESANKAEKYTDERFKQADEIKGAMANLVATMMPRTEVQSIFHQFNDKSDARFDSNGAKIDALERRLDRGDGRGAGMSALWGIAVGAVGLISTIIAIVVMLRN